MKTRTGFYTDGNYIMHQSGFTQLWVVETHDKHESFPTEQLALLYICKYLEKLRLQSSMCSPEEMKEQFGKLNRDTGEVTFSGIPGHIGPLNTGVRG